MFSAMNSKLPLFGRELFPRDRYLARFLVHQVRTVISTERVEWPIELDLLLLGVLLEPHKNRTRYNDERYGSIRP